MLNADAFTLSVAGDFDYDEGTITANTTNLTVGGDFSYDDSANDLDWGVNDILTVSGHANIVAAGLLIAELSLLLIVLILPLILFPMAEGWLVQILSI